MVKIDDYFKKGMSPKEIKDAAERFAMKCEEEGQPVPMWVRMQLDDEETVTLPPDMEMALKRVDHEFGVDK